MTTPRTERLARRTAPALVTSTFGGTMAAALVASLARARRTEWPSTKYREDPVAFFREILGVQPWDRQIEVIELVRDNDRVAVSGGRKVSKSCNISGLALWFYCSFDEAQVVLTSAGNRQIDGIIWRELRMMYARSGRCLDCLLAMRDNPRSRIARPCPHSQVIDGELHSLARSGLKSNDFREITGFSASDSVAAQGISGKHLLYLTDESSGIDDSIFHAIIGNLAGGGKLAMFANPTRSEGFFFDAFGKETSFKTITISSRESPNVRAGRTIIRGLATREYIEDAERDYGKDSPFVLVHIDGKFAIREDGKIVSLHAIHQSQTAWKLVAEDSEFKDQGRLFIGVDCAGDSGLGDESAFAVRRGKRIISVDTQRGLTEDGHVVQTLGLISRHRLPREDKPVVVLDRAGLIGFNVYTKFLAYLNEHPDEFILVPFRGSDAPRRPEIYHVQRDEAWSDFELWIREGGMLPEDMKLAKDIHAPSWVPGPKGRMKVTSKEDLRKILGRSPDRADACVLSCWEATPYALGIVDDSGRQAQAEPATEQDPYLWERAMDPYRSQDQIEDQFRRR